MAEKEEKSKKKFGLIEALKKRQGKNKKSSMIEILKRKGAKALDKKKLNKKI